MVEDEEEKGGDITSKIQVWPRNIEEKIYELFLKNFFDEQKIMPKDITEIVQIVADCRDKRTPVPYSADSLRHN